MSAETSMNDITHDYHQWLQIDNQLANMGMDSDGSNHTIITLHNRITEAIKGAYTYRDNKDTYKQQIKITVSRAEMPFHDAAVKKCKAHRLW